MLLTSCEITTVWTSLCRIMRVPEVPESRLDVVDRRSVAARVRVQVQLMEYMLISTDLEEDCGNCSINI